jgi:ABC-type glycerol-3-phosphate transport system substrate-binding protein
MRKSVRPCVFLCALACVLAISGCAPGGLPLTLKREPVVVRFAYHQGIAGIQPLLQEFEKKNPQIRVEALPQSSSSALAALVRDGGVDVFRESRDALKSQSYLRPLDELLTDEWLAIKDDFYRGSWEALSVGGKQWGVPAGVDLYVTYVNQTQLDALRLAAPQPDWTLDQFLELAVKMNYPEGLPQDASKRLFGYCTGLESFDAIVLVYLRGGKIVDDLDTPRTAFLDDTRTIEALEWYRSAFYFHKVAPAPKQLTLAYPRGLAEAQRQGGCGAWFGWYSERGGAGSAVPWAFQWLMLPLPRDRAAISAAELEGYYVAQACTHPQEAMQLVHFMSGRWESAGQLMPPRRSLTNDKVFARAVGDDVAAVAASAPNNLLMIPYELSPGLERVGGALIQVIQRVIAEDLDPGPLLMEAQRRVAPTLQ